MGTELHHAIVISAFDENYAKAAYAKAGELGCFTTNIVQSPINLLFSFMVCPDGSKEGWDESDKGDAQRKELIEFLRVPYTTLMGMDSDPEDQSTPYSWVEVSYGDHDTPAMVADYGDKRRFDEEMAELFKLAMSNVATGPLTASPHICKPEVHVAPQSENESKEIYADRIAKELSALGVDLEPIHITNYDYGHVMDPTTKLDDRVELRDLDDEDTVVLFRFKRPEKFIQPPCDHRLEYRRRDTFSTAGIPAQTSVREICTGCGVVLFDTNPDKTSRTHDSDES